MPHPPRRRRVAEAEASHQTRGILEGRDLSAFAEDQAAVEEKAGGKTGRDFLDVFRQMVPPNVVAAAANGQLLGLIVVSLLVGYFLARSEGKPREVIEAFVQGVYDITLRITDIVLRLAPVGVLGLLAATFAEQYAKLAPDARFEEFLAGISLFALTAFAALAAHLLIVMPLILALVARVNPLRHYRAMAPALVTAFSTASSSATLPLTMECVEDRRRRVQQDRQLRPAPRAPRSTWTAPRCTSASRPSSSARPSASSSPSPSSS